MGKRIMAIVLLIGFIALLVNMFMIGYQIQLCLLIYGFIVLYYLLFMNRKKASTAKTADKPDNHDNPEEQG